jgi:hypothetical protein
MMPMMKMSKNQKYLGFKSKSKASEKAISELARGSIYFLWWSYLRLSPVLWFAKKTGAIPRDNGIARVAELSGDLNEKNFSKWWSQTGKNIFAESLAPPLVKVLGVDVNVRSPMSTDDTLYLEVPLSISKEEIVQQVREILKVNHAGRGLDLMDKSTAQFPLHTHRYRLHRMETSYWVLLYRLLYRQAFDWQIGDRLQVAPHLKVREGIQVDQRRYHDYTDRSFLGAITGRHLYKARYTVLHAERGEFPNLEEIKLADRYQPFGLRLHTEFREATESRKGESSAWDDWLHKQFATDLTSKIIEINRFDSSLFRSSRPTRRLKAFVDGSSDLLF